jgi:hypothetical protein
VHKQHGRILGPRFAYADILTNPRALRDIRCSGAGEGGSPGPVAGKNGQAGKRLGLQFLIEFGPVLPPGNPGAQTSGYRERTHLRSWPPRDRRTRQGIERTRWTVTLGRKQCGIWVGVRQIAGDTQRVQCFSPKTHFSLPTLDFKKHPTPGSTRDDRDGFWAASSICQKLPDLLFVFSRRPQRLERSLGRRPSIGMHREVFPQGDAFICF